MRFRVGQGYDVHALVPGRPLILAGVRFDSPVGLLGHSDADVLTHALIDALLGAAALGDIGALFPDSDERHRGADSLHMLARVREAVVAQGWSIANVDCTVVAQQPKIAPRVAEMRERLAGALQLAVADISIKGKTTEWLGFTGRGEGIAALAVAALVSG